MSFSANCLLKHHTRDGKEIVSFNTRYPRMVHSEVMTHRVFSRNASSSRAIPIWKVIQDVLDDPAIPIHWGKHQPGMQAFEETDALVDIRAHGSPDIPILYSREEAWLEARDNAVKVATSFMKAGYHKQIVNRILEPFAHINVVITTTNVSNFFALRRHKDADPTIRKLADEMYESYINTDSLLLNDGVWHLPFVRHSDWLAGEKYLVDKLEKVAIVSPLIADELTQLMIQVSVARCARTSYRLHDGSETNFEDDIGLYDRLLSAVPLHASPAEHQATPDCKVYKRDFLKREWKSPELHGNFDGLIQFRKLLPGEFQ